MVWNRTEHELTCDASGVTHHLEVNTPFRYDRMDDAPLILCMDGAWTSGAVRDASRIMSMSGEAPEAIVAGLSFTDDTMSEYLRSRARWFCPTQWVPPEIVGVKGGDPQEFGHSLVYLDFIRTQVLPLLEQQYRTSTKWLVGHSFSGLFSLQVLLTSPELFDGYLLASPSIWWHDRVMLEIAEQQADGRDDIAARVFMTAGENEDALLGFNMAANMIEMATRLGDRNYPSLEIDHAVLPAESHSSTIGQAVSRGLRFLHATQ